MERALLWRPYVSWSDFTVTQIQASFCTISIFEFQIFYIFLPSLNFLWPKPWSWPWLTVSCQALLMIYRLWGSWSMIGLGHTSNVFSLLPRHSKNLCCCDCLTQCGEHHERQITQSDPGRLECAVFDSVSLLSRMISRLPGNKLASCVACTAQWSHTVWTLSYLWLWVAGSTISNFIIECM